jgi:hypothetical protein
MSGLKVSTGKREVRCLTALLSFSTGSSIYGTYLLLHRDLDRGSVG